MAERFTSRSRSLAALGMTLLPFRLARAAYLLTVSFAFVFLLGCAEQPVPAGQLVINRPAPTVNAISPSAAVAGSPSITLVITGHDFANDAVVTFGGQAYKPQEVTGSQITVSIPSSALAQIGSRTVGVINPASGGGPIYALTSFQVIAPSASPYQQYSTITPPTPNPYPGAANPAYGQFPTGSPSGATPYGQFPDGGPGGAPPYGQMPNGTNTTPPRP